MGMMNYLRKLLEGNLTDKINSHSIYIGTDFRAIQCRGRLVTSHCWDDEDPRLLVCRAQRLESVDSRPPSQMISSDAQVQIGHSMPKRHLNFEYSVLSIARIMFQVIMILSHVRYRNQQPVLHW